MFIHCNICKLPVTTSAHPHIRILPTANFFSQHAAVYIWAFIVRETAISRSFADLIRPTATFCHTCCHMKWIWQKTSPCHTAALKRRALGKGPSHPCLRPVVLGWWHQLSVQPYHTWWDVAYGKPAPVVLVILMHILFCWAVKRVNSSVRVLSVSWP